MSEWFLVFHNKIIRWFSKSKLSRSKAREDPWIRDLRGRTGGLDSLDGWKRDFCKADDYAFGRDHKWSMIIRQHGTIRAPISSIYCRQIVGINRVVAIKNLILSFFTILNHNSYWLWRPCGQIYCSQRSTKAHFRVKIGVIPGRFGRLNFW